MTERRREEVKREQEGVKRIAHRNAARTSGPPINQPTKRALFKHRNMEQPERLNHI